MPALMLWLRSLGLNAVTNTYSTLIHRGKIEVHSNHHAHFVLSLGEMVQRNSIYQKYISGSLQTLLAHPL